MLGPYQRAMLVAAAWFVGLVLFVLVLGQVIG